MAKLSQKETEKFVGALWDSTIVPTLEEYIRIPNQSPLFDKQWETNNLQEEATELIVAWIKKQGVKGLTVETMSCKGRTPMIYVEVKPTDPISTGTVMLYGHLDKQPPMESTWNPEFGGPHDPRIIDGKLYGRGGADDGYSAFAAVGAIAALQAQGVAHSRCVVTIEACEESLSRDLPYYMDLLADRIGTPDIIVCLDSGCATYDQLWLTTSLRGAHTGVLTVEILKEGVHSGKASGIVPSSFRIIRQLLSRVENEQTGELLVPELFAEIPPGRVEEAHHLAEELGDAIFTQFPFVDKAGPVPAKNIAEMQLNGTWRPTLCVTAAGGLPSVATAGNVLRTSTSLNLSVRLPPTVSPRKAGEALKKVFEKDPPYGAKVEYALRSFGGGWNVPPMQPWLSTAVMDASMNYFGKPVRMQGEGGSIPFMGMLADKFPKAQFVITGVLGPNSNAHGPNEFLHIQMGKNVTSSVAHILAVHCHTVKH